MKIKIVSYILFLIGFAILLSGCGSRTWTEKYYYYPNWMPDGRIICMKDVMTFSQNIWGEGVKDTKTYIAAMSSEGTNEVNLFKVSDIFGEIACSPVGEKIAFISKYGPENSITVCNYDGSGKVILTAAASAEYLDWSPDGNKIAYSGNNNLFTINADGTSNTQIATSAEVVAWRTGDQIAFAFSDDESSKVYTINSDGSNKEAIVLVGGDPQISNTDKIIYSGYSLQVRQVEKTGANDILLFDGYNQSTLKLSFDNSKICGGDIDQSNIKGIWVINIDGTGAKRLR